MVTIVYSDKEVIRLYIFPRLPFTPYHDPSPPLWELVSNIMSSFYQFINFQALFISVADYDPIPSN